MPKRLRITAQRRAWLENLPPINAARFVKQSPDARAPCPRCGEPDRAVTSQPWITWYGPIRCPACRHRRPRLRQVMRRIDLDWLRETTGLRSEAAYRSALRERAELQAAGVIGGRPSGKRGTRPRR